MYTRPSLARPYNNSLDFFFGKYLQDAVYKRYVNFDDLQQNPMNVDKNIDHSTIFKATRRVHKRSQKCIEKEAMFFSIYFKIFLLISQFNCIKCIQ